MKNRPHLPVLGPAKPIRTSKMPSKSLKNAYIYLMGQAGSGKSTTFNYLFGGREISPTERENGTKEVLEFSSKLKSGFLRIIDTPGLGDINGVVWDSQIITTFDNFQESHEDLNSHIPNVVMIFGSFDDNRIEGDSSNFVKMLKSVDLRREKIFDFRNNNLIILLTHTMNGKKALRENPTPRIELVKSLIKTFTHFPYPPIILLAENEAEDFELARSKNGSSFILPNGDEYPQNIINAIFEICRISGDSSGFKIFQEAFDDQARQNLSFDLYHSLNLVGEGHSMDVVAQLSNIYLNKRSTEMMQKLAIEWNALGRSCTEPVYQDFLSELESKNYKDFHQLPENPKEVIKFMLSFKREEDLVALIENVMKLNIPTLNEVNQLNKVGFGYYTATDDFLPLSPIEFLNFKTSPSLLYKLPEEIQYEALNRSGEPNETPFFHFLRDRKDYCFLRTRQLQLKDNVLTEGFMKSGYNFFPGPPDAPPRKNRSSIIFLKNKSLKSLTMDSHKVKKGQNVITLVKEFRLGKLSYEKSRSSHNLEHEFVSAVRQLQPFTRSRVGAKQWRTFFSKYGTHIVKSAFLGGTMEILMDGAKFHSMVTDSKINLETARERDIEKLHKEIYAYFFEPQKRIVSTLMSFDIPSDLIVKVNFIGGNNGGADSGQNFLEMAAMDRINLIREWKTSLYELPIILGRELELIEMKEFVKQCSIENQKLEKVVNSYDTGFETLLVSLPLQSRKNCVLL